MSEETRGEVIYTCPSNLHYEVTYDKFTVECKNGIWYCGCHGGKYGYICKHIKKAKAAQCGGYREAFYGVGPKEPGTCHCGEELVPIFYEEDYIY
jgi:hypothetical protein